MESSTLAMVFVLGASAVYGQAQGSQTQERVFHLTYTESPQAAQEIANTVRVMSGNPPVSVTGSTITLRGTAGQAALGEWLVEALDRPAGAQAPEKLEYAAPGAPDAMVRVFYVANAATPQGMQELMNAVRTIADTPYLYVSNQVRAIVARGTAGQIAAAEWLINALDKPAPAANRPNPTPDQPEFQTSDPRAPIITVVNLSPSGTPRDGQEVVNVIRTIAEVTRIVICNQPKALAVRGTAERIALTRWLVQALSKPPGAPSAAQSSLIDEAPIVKVFYLGPAETPQGMEELMNRVRAGTRIARVVVCNAPKALTLRGTDGQIAAAEQLIQAAQHQ